MKITKQHLIKIIKMFVDKAKEEGNVYYGGIEVIPEPNFTEMSDYQIRKWLLDYGLLNPKGELDSEIKQLLQNGPCFACEGGAYHTFMNRYAESWNDKREPFSLDESKKHKKYSSFKGQQTITENFRKFLNKKPRKN